jgi:hypothetical protein
MNATASGTQTSARGIDPSPFERAARVLIERGVPVIPLRPATKIAFHQNWPELASIDPKQIADWGEQYPEANVACVAKATLGGVWFFEVDAPNFHLVIQNEAGKKIPTTFTVKSSEKRGHFYFKHNSSSIAMGNLQGKIEGKEAWSVRADNRYVVGPGSIHPVTQKPYTVLVEAPLVEAPDWLIEWFVKNNSSESGRVNASPDGPPIPHGSHDTELFRIACMLRNAGMDYEQIRDNLVTICEKRCVNHGSDYVNMCENKAKSACKYKVGFAATASVGGRVDQSATAGTAPEIEFPEIPVIKYPVFPQWVMGGTSIYEGLVKPVCDVNSRYPEYMFLPAYVTLLNYLHGKVRVEDKSHIPSIFLLMIGRKGRVIKSSSAQDAIKYLETAGLVAEGAQVANAEGKTLMYRPASPEGLGKDMARSNCKNALLFYDELSALVGKVGIESSGLGSALLTLYESGYFSNLTKSRKDSYAFKAGSYCTSLIACTTETDFSEQWAQLVTGKRGMDERFFFLYQPEKLVPLTPHTSVDTLSGAAETQRRVAMAVAQGTYQISDSFPLEARINELGNRTEIRAEKFALAFAVDLGRPEIDDGCVERALALAKYEKDVKRYLGGSDESVDRLAAAQNKYCRMLQHQPQGMMRKHEAERGMNYQRYSTENWYRIVNGLERSKRIVMLPGERKDSAMVRLARLMEFEE